MSERAEYFEGEKAFKAGKDYFANPYSHLVDQFTNTRCEAYRQYDAWARGHGDAEFDAKDFAA